MFDSVNHCTLFIFSFCCTLYWFLEVNFIYCKRGHQWWSLTWLMFPLCVCLKSVRDSSRCKHREEQECFRLANCRSCSLNINCQWELQQQECQALPGEETIMHTERTNTQAAWHTYAQTTMNALSAAAHIFILKIYLLRNTDIGTVRTKMSAISLQDISFSGHGSNEIKFMNFILFRVI